MTQKNKPDPLFPELIAELNAPSRESLIDAVMDLSHYGWPDYTSYFDAQKKHADTIKWCMENGK